MECKKCGKELNKGNPWCIVCGTNNDRYDSEEEIIKKENNDDENNESYSNYSSYKRIYILIPIVFIILVGFVYAFLNVDLRTFDILKKRAKLVQEEAVNCPVLKGNIEKVRSSGYVETVLTKNGDVYLAKFFNETTLINKCIKIDEIENAVDIWQSIASLYVKDKEGKYYQYVYYTDTEKDKVIILSKKETTKTVFPHEDDDNGEKNLAELKIVDSFDGSSYINYIGEDNSIYTYSYNEGKQIMKKIVDGSIFDSKIRIINDLHELNVATDKYYYIIENGKVISKTKTFHGIKARDIIFGNYGKMTTNVSKKSYTDRVYKILKTNAKVYEVKNETLADVRLSVNLVTKKEMVTLAVVVLLITICAYLGRERSIIMSFIKSMAVSFIVFNILYITNIPFKVLLNNYKDLFELLTKKEMLVSNLKTALSCAIIYSIAKKTSWLIMDKLGSVNKILFTLLTLLLWVIALFIMFTITVWMAYNF